MAEHHEERKRRFRRILCVAPLCVAVVGCVGMPTSEVRSSRIEAAVVPMAEAALDAGQMATARRLYDRLLEVDPNNVPARMGLGDVAMAEAAPGLAAEAYLGALAVAAPGPARHAALLAHARAALAAGDLVGARRSFERLADPDEAAATAMVAWGFNGIGVVRLLEGNPTAAAAFFAVAVGEDPAEQRFQANLEFVRRATVPDANGQPE